MKRRLLTLAMICAASTALADPVEGIWQTEADEGKYAHIALAPCGDKICGTISKAFDASGPIQSANLGKPLVWDMVAQGGGKYGKGKIWQPSTGKVFRSKMVLSGDQLNVSGCVGPICKQQKWSRVN